MSHGGRNLVCTGNFCGRCGRTDTSIRCSAEMKADAAIAAASISSSFSASALSTDLILTTLLYPGHTQVTHGIGIIPRCHSCLATSPQLLHEHFGAVQGIMYHVNHCTTILLGSRRRFKRAGCSFVVALSDVLLTHKVWREFEPFLCPTSSRRSGVLQP
jgi:hypothetical protein